ncbi:hypothetical protein CKO50_18445, partial [Pseudoalteromonas sp. HM-SA03]|uniref:hypothetical protein n=2 Tax=unclassified Pseudoalteromonas TaxID=194690 RepID=UPI000BDA041F
MRTTRYNGFFEEYNILHFMGERKKGLALFDSETDGEDFQTIQREMWRFHLVLDEGGFKRF